MKPLAVYVHVPFCTVKCGYCDFNAYAGMQSLAVRYRDALLAQIDREAQLLAGRRVTSIAFGGGTPNEVPHEHITAVIERVYSAAGSVAGDVEISLEANPGVTSEAQLAGLRRAGVTRVSFGAQSFDASELRFLDRIHSAEAAAASVGLARAAGIESVNLDLIYGIPGQSLDRWEATLRQAVALTPDHLSCYALTVEEGTPLARRVERGEVAPADPDLVADMYERAAEFLGAAGYRHYELSNWARPGHESRHNLTYWTDGDYLGLGAGAHGYIDGERYENVAHPRDYVGCLERDGDPRLNCHRAEPATAMSDWLALRLRLVDGFAPQAFEQRFGVPLDRVAGGVLAECAAGGWIECTPVVRLTATGRQLHSEVAVRLLLAAREVGAAPGEAAIRPGSAARGRIPSSPGEG